MAITKSHDRRKVLLDYSVYVPLGATDRAFEQARSVSKKALELAEERRKSFASLSGDLAKRGEKLAESIRRSVSTRQRLRPP